MGDLIETLRSVIVAPLFGLALGGCFLMLCAGLYQAGLEQFFEEVGKAENPSAVMAIEQVLIRRLAKMSQRFLSASRAAALKRKMIMAGLDMRETVLRRPEDFIAMQELGALGGALLILWLAIQNGLSLVWIPVGMLGCGLVMPNIWLNDQVKKRHLLITRALPYNLDLLTLSVEAGLDFTAALAKVVERGRKGPLLEELGLVLRQLKMGKTRADSLKMMVDRVNLTSLSTFVSALIQADRMGTPLGKVLRIQSAQLRIERTQRAEKLAGEAPVKMLGPLVLCIMPTIFLVLFGPVIFQFKFGG
ncbi:MAG: type II secretion system F family protein [Deltaproteobacteria bacterium]